MLQGFENIITAVRDWVNFKFQPKGDYSLIENTGYSLSLSIDSDYIMTIRLKNADGDVLSEKSIDFPIESMVIGADYANGIITLTLQNGQTLDIDVSALVNGLVNDTFTIAGIDMKDDITKEELTTALGIGDKLDKDGDASDTTVTFSQATTRENIASGEKQNVIFGKIKKFFTDLKTVAFTGNYGDLSNKPTAADINALSLSGGIMEENAQIKLGENGLSISEMDISRDGSRIVRIISYGQGEEDKAASIRMYGESTNAGDGKVIIDAQNIVLNGKVNKILDTPEQIDANTEEGYIAGALAVKAIKSDLEEWIDLTAQCDWKINLTHYSGEYRSFIRYNRITKQIVGLIYTNSAINNQKKIVVLPNLEGIGENPYIGFCGMAIFPESNMIVTPRIVKNEIYSSHNKNEDTSGEGTYLINFIAL